MEEVREKPIRQTMQEMEIGDTIQFPITSLNTVRVSCTQYGLQWGKRFSTSINRTESTIDVTRVE